MASARRTIGLVSPFVSGVFLGEVVIEVLRQAPEFDCDIVVFRTGDWRKVYDTDLSTRLCDGWLVVLGEYGPRAVEAMTSGGRPVCSIAKAFGYPSFSLVQSDNALGVRLALDTLVEAGHRAIAFVGNLENPDIEERRQAFVGYLQEKGLPLDPSRIVDTIDANPSGGRKAALDLIQRGIDFTAVMVGNDQNAVGVLEVFRERGYRIPQDLALVGYDNSSYAQDARYQLSSLDQAMPLLVRTAFEEVFRRIDRPGAAARTIRVPPTLVPRSSSVLQAAPQGRPPYPPEMADRIITSLHYGSEVSRYLSSETNVSEVETMLNRLSLQGRHTQFSTIGEALPLGTFGSALWDRHSRRENHLFLLPIFHDTDLTHALALVVPKDQITDLAELALFAHELELMSVSLERSVAIERLELLVEKRTTELRAAQQRLIQSAKLEVMTPIVTGIAHHLNTPLGNCLMVVSDLDLQVDRKKADPTYELSLGFLRNNLDRTIHLVERFRHVANLQITDEMVRFSLHKVVGEAVVMAHAQHARPDIEADLPEGDLPLVGSPTALREAVKALLENALVHGCREQAGPRVWVTVARRGAQASLTVGDNGPGVDQAHLGRIFEPFYTTRLADSSGLGLTLAYNVVVTMFGGTVGTKTGAGQGFQIECVLPLAP